MFCIYCIYFKGLKNPCEKDIKMTDIDRVMKCKHYTYNQGVRE